MVKIICASPLNIADRAIGTCWDIQKDETDIDRMLRVCNKFKHRSTVEHLRVTFLIKDDKLTEELKEKFKTNPYSVYTPVTNEKGESYFVVSTNARVLLEAKDDGVLSEEELKKLIPDEWAILFNGKES